MSDLTSGKRSHAKLHEESNSDLAAAGQTGAHRQEGSRADPCPLAVGSELS